MINSYKDLKKDFNIYFRQITLRVINASQNSNVILNKEVFTDTANNIKKI